MKKLLHLILGASLAVIAPAVSAAKTAPQPPLEQYGQWLDTDGNPVNAHGAGMLYHNGKYYLYGEYKKGKKIGRASCRERV